MTTTAARHARVCDYHPPHPRLIHPLHEEFSVYGGDDVVERARAWALQSHYLLVDGVEPCAHGLYLMDCPSYTCRTGQVYWWDHTNMWADVGCGGFGQPFLLSATYAGAATARKAASAYAQAHGLDAGCTLPWDDWYYPGHTTPIRLSVDSHTVWPIEREITALLALMPVTWPADCE